MNKDRITELNGLIESLSDLSEKFNQFRKEEDDEYNDDKLSDVVCGLDEYIETLQRLGREDKGE